MAWQSSGRSRIVEKSSIPAWLTRLLILAGHEKPTDFPKGADGHDLVAQVADGSPAQEAGIRNGDVLLRVNDSVITKANYDGYRRFSAPAGTKIRLTLSNTGKIFSTTATLREILSPTTDKK